MKVFLILAATIAISACGTEKRSAPKPTIPHEEPRPNPIPPPPMPRPEPQVCWEELRCKDVEVKTRDGCVMERICKVIKVCEQENSTENMRQNNPWQL